MHFEPDADQIIRIGIVEDSEVLLIYEAVLTGSNLSRNCCSYAKLFDGPWLLSSLDA